MTLLTCDSGKPYRVIALAGGQHFQLRLRNLGLAEGKLVVKTAKHPFGGPVTIRVEQTELALGHGMAERIVLEEAQ